MKVSRRSNTGLTLIELLFACGIIASTLTVIFTALIGMGMIQKNNASRLEAVDTLSSVLEEINNTAFTEVLGYVAPEFEVPGVARTIEVALLKTDGTPVKIPMIVSDFKTAEWPNIVEVQVTLKWQEQDGRVYQIKGSTTKGQAS